MEREQCFGCDMLDGDWCKDQEIEITEIDTCEVEDDTKRSEPIQADEQEEEPDLSEMWPDGLEAV